MASYFAIATAFVDFDEDLNLITVSNAAALAIGDQIALSGFAEVMLVDAVTPGSNNVHVIRGHGGTPQIGTFPSTTTSVRVLGGTDANAPAATLPGLTAFKAATDDARTAALLLASDRFDTARRYQGCKVDPSQALEFPRFSDAARAFTAVWDFDDLAAVAVVPARVQRAVLYEANSILIGDRDARRQALADGLTSQSTGPFSESYAAPSVDGVPVLSMEAERISRLYQLRSGRML